MRISRLTKFFAVAASVVLLAACSSNSGSSSSSSSSGGPVTLTWFMWSGSDVEKNAWLHIADMVTQKYPNRFRVRTLLLLPIVAAVSLPC